MLKVTQFLEMIENGMIDKHQIPKRGGGVCCYVKDSAMVSSHELSNLNISTINAEILWLTLDHPRMNKICIANVYRPPQGNVQIFCDILEEQITFLKEKFNHEPEIFIMGDCNIDYLRPREANTKSLKWIEQSMGLKQLIKNTTRYSTIESCIDLIFTNCDKIKSSDIHDLNISDHQMISVTRKHLTKPNNSNSFIGRSYRNYNRNLFFERLNALQWNELYATNNPTTAWSILYKAILNVIDIMCPQKIFNIKKMRDPWVSDELLEVLYEKDRLLKKAKRTKLEADWIKAKNARNNANNIARNAKSNFIKENLEIHKNDSKSFWKSINTILPNKNNKKTNIINLADDNNNPIRNNAEASNFMNDFFVTIGPNLAKEWDKHLWTYQGIYSNNDIPDIITDEREVLKLCTDINTTKSSAIEGLNSKILRMHLYVYLDN